MDFTTLIAQRQSCRSYDPQRTVSTEALQQCLEAARMAPSACNAQPYHFTVCTGENAKLAAKELNRRCGEAQANLELAQSRLDTLPPSDPAFEGKTAQEAYALVSALQQQSEEQRQLREQNDVRDGLKQKRNRIKLLFKLMVGLFGFGGLAMVIAGFIARVYSISYWGFGMMFLTVALSIVFVLLLGSIEEGSAAAHRIVPVDLQMRESVRKLYQERAALYADCADAVYANETSPEQCANAIREGFDEALRS